MNLLEGKSVILTGGSGTLGRAIAERRKKEGWGGKFTVYSTDNHKHNLMRKLYPDINFVQGDIRNPETLYNAMVGHDICLHLAAVKVIPDSEYYSLDTIDVNINGSYNVCVQAMNAGIKQVLGISTDKSSHPANAYGATKYLMEKIFQEYSRTVSETKFNLVRYGNVLESTGSVIESWKNSIERGQPIQITSPNMTRFWISPNQAVDLVLRALECESGEILIPIMKSLSIGKLAEYTLGEYKSVELPIRPGEKMHETLLAIEETQHARKTESNRFYILQPTTGQKTDSVLLPFSSDVAVRLTKDELMELLQDG